MYQTFAEILAIFVETANRVLLRKRNSFFVYIMQGNAQDISILEQVHDAGIRKRNKFVVGNDYMILQRYSK